MSTAFAIATVSVESGGRVGVCALPGRFGDLASDVFTIAAWRAEIVVSMTEEAEMKEYGAHGLGALLADAAIDWAHLPIRDYGGPSGIAEEAWPALAARLHDILDRGGGVVLHCKGGQGRSGMVALRLLVERGEPVEEALARLRAIRPGAVEGRAQLIWASQGAATG
ncbi:hypothetical protein [Chelativorans salis]|uniref:Tyrosine specific protein phosphatases domain-containing protein n=1 Tax=Chelativorans salis TaxID=2978478 RepID=A0ABT2LHE3_9HYPH|nr:hypothetical protein [Chelativorans sp. EGI FJ00035]MCT7373853.1 hypothetical protein [Chelativorans sp. EGI FJ00035]